MLKSRVSNDKEFPCCQLPEGGKPIDGLGQNSAKIKRAEGALTPYCMKESSGPDAVKPVIALPMYLSVGQPIVVSQVGSGVPVAAQAVLVA